MEERRTQQTRVRVSFKVSAKGIFQPDITSEAETVATAVENLAHAKAEMYKFAVANGYKTEEQ